MRCERLLQHSSLISLHLVAPKERPSTCTKPCVNVPCSFFCFTDSQKKIRRSADLHRMNCGCTYCISTSELGIIENVGKYERTEGAGCHCVNCFTESLAGRLSLRIQTIDARVETKTQDSALVVVRATILYKVLPERAQDAFYKFSNPHEQIRSFASNVIRGQVPLHPMDELFTIRDEMQKTLREELEEQLTNYGFNIVATLITDIDPSNEIKQAMSQIRTNACLRLASMYEADVDKIRIVKAAEADSEAKRLSGVGLAEQRKAAILGLQSSVSNFSHSVKGMESKDVLALLMMNQYFDAIKDIAATGRGNVVFLPANSNTDMVEGIMAAESGKKRK